MNSPDAYSSGADLSDATIVYLKHFPRSNMEEFRAYYDDDDACQAALERVQDLLADAVNSEIDMSSSLTEIGAQVRQAMQARRPELSDEAVRRLGNYVTYLVK